MSGSKVVIIGGGTFNHISCHLSLAAPAFGATARSLANTYKALGAEVELILTKMADHTSKIVTSGDLSKRLTELVEDRDIKVLVMNAAVCDFEMDNPSDQSRLSSSQDYPAKLLGLKAKLVRWFKDQRPDVIVVGFKTTHDAKWTTQVSKAALSLEQNGIDIVLANDVATRSNIVVTRDMDLESASRDWCLGFVATRSLEMAEQF